MLKHFVLLLCIVTTCVVRANAVELANNGAAKLPVVIAPDASQNVKDLAVELAEYLKRIAGADFKVETGNGQSGIVVGTLAQFPVAELKQPLEMRGPYDGKEAFAIRTEKDRVLLIGRTELGASYAAYRFLETLGVRWFFPAKEWEVVPTRSTLRYEVNEASRPKILARRIWYNYGYFGEPDEYVLHTRAYREHMAWNRRNRMGQSVVVYAGHAWDAIILANLETFEKNPEYLALVNGKRQMREVAVAAGNTNYPEAIQFCVSEPAVRKIAVDWALKYLKDNPEADMVSLDPADSPAHCECEECKAMGSVSDRVFGLVNEAARAVQKAFPGKMVGCLAYSAHSEPPSFDLEPNVFIQLTAGFTRGQYSFEELLELWPQKSDHMGFYEYFSVFQWDWDMPTGARGADVKHIQNRVRDYAARNAMAFDAESANNWGLNGRGYYIASRLLWNPEADVEKLLEDFYDKAFGPAAAPMQRFYERLDPGNKPWKVEGLYAQAFHDVQEASTLAKDNPDVLARLRHIKIYLRYVQLRAMLDKTPAAEKEKRKQLALEILKHVYRTRWSYMNHWRAMELSWSSNIGVEVGAPEWWINDPSPKPWTDTPEYSAVEIERLFQEGLKAFEPPPVVDEKKFSNDLVPVVFEGNPAREVSVGFQLSPAPFAFYSLKGEPIKFSILTSTTGNRNKPPQKYIVRDANQKIIARGELPQDTQKHELEIKVPNAGLYFLEYNDQGTGWRIFIPETQPYSQILWRAFSGVTTAQMQQSYFYVPQGTRELQFFAGAGYAFEILNADAKLAQAVPPEGGYFKVPVPPGMDGKLWAVDKMALYHLWFFNAPNVISASPQTILLPREVAEKDGLEIQ